MAFEVLWNQVFICLSDLLSCHDNLDDASKIPVFTFPKDAAPAGCQPSTLLSLLLSSIFISHYSAFSWNVTSLATFSLTIWPKEQSASSQHPIWGNHLCHHAILLPTQLLLSKITILFTYFFVSSTRTYTPYVSLRSLRSKHQDGNRCARVFSRNSQERKCEGNRNLRESSECDSSVNLSEGERARMLGWSELDCCTVLGILCKAITEFSSVVDHLRSTTSPRNGLALVTVRVTASQRHGAMRSVVWYKWYTRFQSTESEVLGQLYYHSWRPIRHIFISATLYKSKDCVLSVLNAFHDIWYTEDV